MSAALEIREKCENASEEELLSMLEELYKKWEKPEEKTSFLKTIEFGLKNYNLNVDNVCCLVLHKEYMTEVAKLAYLQMYIVAGSLYQDQEKKDEIIPKINKTYRSIVDSYNALQYTLKFQLTPQNVEKDLISFQPFDYSNNNPVQNLILFLQEKLFQEQLRRYKGACYAQIYTKDGKNTHTFYQKYTLENFIYNSVKKETHYDIWQCLTNKSGNAKFAEEHLSKCVCQEFEDIIKDRNIFAYNNGLYFASEDKFVSYYEKSISSSIVASKYFDADFVETDDFYELLKDKTPNFISIMSYQEWSKEVQIWLCILLGRMLYNVASKDDWQIALFLFGLAGTGKSTIINHVLKEFYEEEDVGIMSNNIESKFGLASIVDKFISIAPEIKKDFKLDQAEWQALVSGESMSCAKKNKDPIFGNWKVPSAYAGNELPNYIDNSGSVSRRFVIFLFNKKVIKGDTKLASKLKKEIPYILCASNKAYLKACIEHGSKNIWDVLPQYFIDSNDEITDKYKSFIKDFIVQDADGILCKTDVKTKLEVEYKTYGLVLSDFKTLVEKIQVHCGHNFGSVRVGSTVMNHRIKGFSIRKEDTFQQVEIL